MQSLVPHRPTLARSKRAQESNDAGRSARSIMNSQGIRQAAPRQTQSPPYLYYHTRAPSEHRSAASWANTHSRSEPSFSDIMNFREGDVTQSLHNLLRTHQDAVLHQCMRMCRERNQEIDRDLDAIDRNLHELLALQRQDHLNIHKCNRKFKHYKAVMKKLAEKVGGLSMDVSDSDSDIDEEELQLHRDTWV